MAPKAKALVKAKAKANAKAKALAANAIPKLRARPLPLRREPAEPDRAAELVPPEPVNPDHVVLDARGINRVYRAGLLRGGVAAVAVASNFANNLTGEALLAVRMIEWTQGVAQDADDGTAELHIAQTAHGMVMAIFHELESLLD